MSSGAQANKNNLSRGNDIKGPKISLYQHSAQVSTKVNRNNPTNSDSNNSRQSQTSTNIPDSTPSIVSSKQKANQCDRLLSMFDGNQENSKPILRVNLIKKSNRQSNVLSTISNRSRLLQKREPESPKAPVSESLPANLDSGITTNSEIIGNATITTNSHSKEAKLSTKVVNKQTKKCDDYRSNYEEAKKSQKLVVSLIKDISKTVAKEDLDEMLKEINLAIGEIQQNQNRKGQSSSSQHKKKPDQRMDKSNSKAKVVVITSSSDTSNSSESKGEEMPLGNSDLEQGDTNKTDQINKIDHDSCKRNPKIEPKNVKTDSVNQQHNEDSSNSDIRRHRLHKKLMELSSDEETGSKDRKPNSSRLPDRCLRITSSHAKYISPHRKRSLEERLSRAQEAREKFLEYRANKFRDILKKVEEMRAWKEEDTLNLKASVQTKLQKAAEKRKEQLDKIIKKAHDEESKVSEIQFINNLEAQNRRHDMNSRKKEFEARLQDLQDERQRRFEEKQAKEVAAEERRKNLEAERKAKLIEIQHRRKLKTQKVEQQQQVKERKRLERNKDRDQKITAIKEAYDAGVQTLRKRIDQKQEQSERRHEVNLRLIRQKAFELSIKRYNSFISGTNAAASQHNLDSIGLNPNVRQTTSSETKRLQLKPFNTKKFCNLCKETISSEAALFSHLRSENHHSSINEHYENVMLTTNEAVEIHNLRHIVETDLPLDADGGSNSQQSSRASSLVNYYHSSYLSQASGGICMSENDRESLLAIEKRCRKLRHKLIVAGKPFNREWFSGKIRSRLAQLLVQQRVARNQTTNTELANTIDLSANNVNCQHNKPFYLKINRITRELISITTDQRISGGGLMPAGIIHSVDRLLADLNKQLTNRKVPQLSHHLLQQQQQDPDLAVDHLAMATKMIEFYAIDTLFLYDIVSCLVSILRRIVPNVSLTSKLPSTVASHYSTLIDPVSLNSYYCHRAPILSARIYIKMINSIKSLCEQHADLCYVIFQSNNMIFLSDILSYRLGFIIGNESPASSISGSSSAATLSAQTIDSACNNRNNNSSGTKSASGAAAGSKQNYNLSSASSFAQRSPSNLSSNSATTGSYKFQTKEAPRSGRSFGGVGCNGKVDNDGNLNGPDDGHDLNGADEDDDGLWDRTETYKRTEEVVDDMTAGLCKLLATVTETILSRPLILLNQIDKTAFDQRSDDFISYMVQVGIVDTESVIMSHIHQQQNQQQQQQQHPQSLLSAASQTGSISGGSNNLGPTNTSNSTAAAADRSNADALCATASSMANSSTANQQQLAASSSAQPLATMGQTSLALAAPGSANGAGSMSTTSNKIINFTTSCIQFVTSLVKLVIAKLPPDDERPPEVVTLQDTTQLLVTLKMTQLSGVLTLVYDMLVQAFNSLSADQQQNSSVASQQQTNSPPNDRQQYQQQQRPETLERQLALALHSIRLINYVAYIDVGLLQDILASDEMLPLQLRHVCGYLISYLVQTQFKLLEDQVPMAGGATETGGQLYARTDARETSGDLLKNELLNEIILLLGHFAYLNKSNQLILKSGCRRPTIIEQLVQLPFDYFSRTKLKLVLMPTLISCAYLNEQICSLVCRELSLSMLNSFIEDQLLGAQLENTNTNSSSSNGKQHQQQQQQQQHETKPTTSATSKNRTADEPKETGSGGGSQVCSLVADDLTNTRLVTSRWRFERRFAKSKWLGAKKYFDSQQSRMRLKEST